MKHMKKMIALVLALISVFAITVPAFAKSNRDDVTVRTTCATCGAPATKIIRYSQEGKVGEEYEYRTDGTYIRMCYSVPYTINCSTGNTSHIERDGFKYWTGWQKLSDD